jgi:hypothetical protein
MLASASALTCQVNRHEFVVDSGSSQHMVSEKDLIRDPKGKHSVIYVANGNKLFSNVTGRVNLCPNVSLNNVLHVPDLSSNLLSVTQVTNKGYTVVFDKEK